MISEGDEKVCTHGVCNCLAEMDNDYCSPYCEDVGSTTNNTVDDSQEMICDCGHPGCVG